MKHKRFAPALFLFLALLLPTAGIQSELHAQSTFRPGPLRSMSDYNRAFARLYRVYRGKFGRFRFYPNNAAVRAAETETFLTRGRNEFRAWRASKAELKGFFDALAVTERNFLRRAFANARARDKRSGGFKNVSDFLTRDRRRAALRKRQVASIQRLLNRTDSRLNKRFRYQFHLKLDQELKNLRERGADSVAAQARKREVNTLIDRLYNESTRGMVRRRRYMRHMTAWFFDRIKPKPVVVKKKEPVVVKKKEPVVVKKEPVVVKKEPVVKKKEPVVVKKEPVIVKREPKKEPKKVVRPKPVAKKVVKKEPPKRKLPVLPCKNNSCDLTEYRRFAAALKRTCYRSGMPDVLIKHCFENFVTMDLSLPRQKEIFYFLRFDSKNYYERLSGLRYFEETCYKFKPVLELGESMLKDPRFGITPEQKFRIRSGLEKIKSCTKRTGYMNGTGEYEWRVGGVPALRFTLLESSLDPRPRF